MIFRLSTYAERLVEIAKEGHPVHVYREGSIFDLRSISQADMRRLYGRGDTTLVVPLDQQPDPATAPQQAPPKKRKSKKKPANEK